MPKVKEVDINSKCGPSPLWAGYRDMVDIASIPPRLPAKRGSALLWGVEIVALPRLARRRLLEDNNQQWQYHVRACSLRYLFNTQT